MGSMDAEGNGFDNKGKLIRVVYKGVLIDKDECSIGEWKRILADKNSFWGRLLMW